MEKSYTLQLIDNNPVINKRFEAILRTFFDKIEVTSDLYESFDYYHHYKPDIIVLASNRLFNDYEPFLKKVKKNYSTPVIIFIEPKEVMDMAQALNYNFNYAILDEQYEQNIKYTLSESLLKVKLIEKLLTGYNQKFSTLEKNKAIIENSHIPTLITNGDIENLKCNKSFLNYFNLKQETVNKKLEHKSFINQKELKDILKTQDLTQEQIIKINGREYQCKIYVLQKYELYLITFASLLSGNKLIDLQLKNELETMLQRVDKNFDDYVKLQYNMIELTSKIRSFLTVNTEKSFIDSWLISNKSLVEALEREFDSTILEELKINLYINN